MSQSDYLSVKKKLILYNSISQRSTNNTNISNSIQTSTSINNDRYFSTKEEVNAANQVRRYQTCIPDSSTIFTTNNICNVKLETIDKKIYALQTY